MSRRFDDFIQERWSTAVRSFYAVLSVWLVFCGGTAVAAAQHSSVPRYAHPKPVSGGGCVYSVCVDLITSKADLSPKEQCFAANVYRACT